MSLGRMPGVLDEQVAAALAESPLDLSAFDVRDLPALRAGAPVPPAGPGVRRSRHVVPGDPEVVLYVHRPEHAGSDRACLLWMHGGGYVMGAAEGNATVLDHWSRRYDCVVVSVEYRLAPEHPYPAAIEDCFAGLTWVMDNRDELGVDIERVGVAGSSAGAGLAAGLALLARDRGQLPLSFQYLLHPMLDDRRSTESSGWRDSPVWPHHANGVAWAAYLGDVAGRGEVPAYAAPARASDLVGLPPALVLVGSADGFVDECVEYARRLVHAGVSTDLRVYSGAPHGFMTMAPGTALARRAERDTEEWLSPFLESARVRAAR